MTLLTTQMRAISQAFKGQHDRVIVQPVDGLEKVAARQGWKLGEKEESTGICIVIKGCTPNA